MVVDLIMACLIDVKSYFYYLTINLIIEFLDDIKGEGDDECNTPNSIELLGFVLFNYLILVCIQINNMILCVDGV